MQETKLNPQGGSNQGSEEPSFSMGRITALLAGPALALLVLLLPPPADMPSEAWRLVAMAIWMVVWWLSEVVDIAVTALLPIVLMPSLEIAPIRDVTENYGHPLIFLFLGGFLLAIAMQSVGLHRRIALSIVLRVGSSPARIVLGFMLATAFLSMWISNTATTIMMYAVALSVIDFVSDHTEDKEKVRGFALALMLGVAYAASIGGVGTLIGTPPNALLASFLASEYQITIDFFQWMLFGIPLVIVMLPLTWLLLTRLLYPASAIAVGDPSQVVRSELEALGTTTIKERWVGLIFLLAALGWILRGPLEATIGLPISDTTVAMVAAILLFTVPIQGRSVLNWERAKALPWGILLLFGAGLALANGFGSTGLAVWIGNQASQVEIETWLLILLVAAVIVFLTEITSNTASTATFLPVLAAVAVGLNLDPQLLTVPVAISASMAFMMPVATPPNAIVFSYPDLHSGDMARAGILLNLLAIALCFVTVQVLVRPILGV